MTQRTPKTASFWCRLMILLLLIMALWNPLVPWGERQTHLIILLDESLSMDTQKARLWPQAARVLAHFQDSGFLTVIQFATKTSVELLHTRTDTPHAQPFFENSYPPRSRPIRNTDTDIASALQSALHYAKTDEHTHILIVSDLNETLGTSRTYLKKAKAAGITVDLIFPHSQTHEPNMWIMSLDVPTRLRSRTQADTRLTVSANFTGKARIFMGIDEKPWKETMVRLVKGLPDTYTFHLPEFVTGSHRVTAAIVNHRDTSPRDNQVTRYINIIAPQTVLHIHSPSRGHNTLGNIVNDGLVQSINATDFPKDLLSLRQYDAIILDDVSIQDLPPEDWATMTDVVKRYGTGLAVIGGPHSFGNGGYKGSALENILPVTTSGKRAPSITLMLLVDKSGSMATQGNRSINLVNQLIQSSLQSLNTHDQIGLIAFDNTAHEILPIMDVQSAYSFLGRQQRLDASGGTKLLPALNLALDRITRNTADYPLIIIISDGIMDTQDTLASITKIQDSKIELLIIAVGRDTNQHSLQRLAQTVSAPMVTIRDTLIIPGIIRKLIEKKHGPLIPDSAPPRQIRLLPQQSTPVSWPAISAHLLTTARKDANVYIESADGDPLMASGRADLGRIAVMLTDPNSWAQAWTQNRETRKLISQLIDWTKPSSRSSQIQINRQHTADGEKFIIDIEARNGTWFSNTSARIYLIDPTGKGKAFALDLMAPGRYTATAQINHPGHYTAIIQVGNIHATYDFEYDHRLEILPTSSRHLNELAKSDLINLLSPGPLLNQSRLTQHKTLALRTPLLSLALMLYLAMLIYERRSELYHMVTQISTGARK